MGEFIMIKAKKSLTSLTYLNELKDYLRLSKMTELKEQFETIEDSYNQAKGANRLYADDTEILHGYISAATIDFLLRIRSLNL